MYVALGKEYLKLSFIYGRKPEGPTKLTLFKTVLSQTKVWELLWWSIKFAIKKLFEYGIIFLPIIQFLINSQPP